MLTRKAYWIKCDIDGRGEKWRLAIEREGGYFNEDDEPVPEYYFPFDDFEEFQENFEDHEKSEISQPRNEGSVEYLASEIVQYMCDRCPETSYETKPGNNCNGCPAVPLKKALEME